MTSRMLCTDCFETSHPQTLLGGSDRIEMVAWLCFALPGWLYCWWRHMLRIKVCGVCGGSSLVREARAAAANDPNANWALLAPVVRNLQGPVRWPRPFATPRDRLHAGSLGAIASILALLGGLLAAADLAGLLIPVICLTFSVLLGTAWWVRSLNLWLRSRARLSSCRAWAADGREIPIEWI